MKRGAKGVFARKNSGTAVPKFADLLWTKYKDAADAETMGPEGVEMLCADLELDPSDVLVLVFAWQLEASRMGYFSRSEWTSGLAKFRAASLPEVKASLEQIHQETLQDARMSHGDHDAFRDFYAFAHRYCRDDNKRNLDTETACAMLEMLLAPLYPRHVANFAKFLAKSNRTHGMNQARARPGRRRDGWMRGARARARGCAACAESLVVRARARCRCLARSLAPRVRLVCCAQDEWICFWELCRTVNEECSDYTDDGAWPILLDEYVEYVKDGAK
jgi:hypothetical protein